MITSQNVRLRPFERSHLSRTREWVNDPEFSRLMDRARPVSDLEHERWFATLHKRKDCLFMAVETIEGACHVGNVWLWNIDWRHRRAELRIVIGDREWTGRGVGTEAITLLCGYAFERLNLHKIYAYVLAANPRARRAFEKAGFALEGALKADRWTGDCYGDVLVFGRLR